MSVSELPPPPPAISLPLDSSSESVPRDGTLFRWQCGALAGMVAGTLGPWASGPFGISVSGSQGDGQIVLALAVIAAVLLLSVPNPRLREKTGKLTAVVVCAALACAVTIYDAFNIPGATDGVASVGWGLLLALVASGALFFATLTSRKR